MNENRPSDDTGDLRCSGSICENLYCYWKIDNFSSLSEPEYTNTPIPMVAERNIQWITMLCIRETEEHNEPIVLYSISCMNDLEAGIMAKISISFRNSDNEIIASNQDQEWMEIPSKDLNAPWLDLDCKRSILLAKLKDDILIIAVEIIYTRSVAKSGQTTSILSDMSPYVALADDFCNLSKRVETDVVIAVGDTEIPAHRAVLSARSPVFAAMFGHDTLEKRMCRIKIDDFEVEVVQSMVRYMYRGTLEHLDLQLALDLIQIGDKYHMDGLISHCTTFLAAQLDESNLVQVLNSVDPLICCADIRAQAIEYICENVSAEDFKSRFSALEEIPDTVFDILVHMKERRSA